MMRYPVTLSKDDNGTFLVSFPDVPGAITYGDTQDEALRHALDALLTLFDAYMKDRRDIPTPSVRAGASVELPALETSKIELYRAMRAGNIGKAELARRLDWHLPQVDRVLNVRHGSRLDQLEAALSAVGRRLVVTVEDARDTRAHKKVRPHLLLRRSSSDRGGAIEVSAGRRVERSTLHTVKRASKKR
jgi:antitoxin HicB